MPATISSDTLFAQARTYSHWTDQPVSDDLLREIYDMVKFGPTSANCSPARFLFIRTQEGKERLRPALSAGNVDQTMAAPVTVIVAEDQLFFDKLPVLFPHTDARAWFTSSPAAAKETAFRNSSLQGGYLIMAARALGLSAGPMSGFDKAAVDAEFFTGTEWRTNFIVNLGYGATPHPHGRLPRLSFEDAALLA